MSNRLADSVSPYLRAHADNPVDWWPWSEEAFAEATRRNVPVFLSIGYSTCHWCHVMARESFQDPQLAAYLNDNMVAIKIDREEHPDVDAGYLAAASAFTGSLGWPLSVFATPSGTVFYAGTYFPPQQVGEVPAFRAVLEAIVEAWRDRRDEVVQTGEAIRDAVAAMRPVDASTLPTRDHLDAAVQRLVSLTDPEFGGLGRGTKFPNAPVLSFLLARGAAGDSTAEGLARHTLATIAASPLRDAVEGGFFRYAVQRNWSEPHYERMLSDNAQLLPLYAAIGIDDPAAVEVAEGIASYLLETLRLPGGGFAAAQDSESAIDGVRSEGGYYALDALARARQPAPALDAKLLSGLNGLAIGGLASAGSALSRLEWVQAAVDAADALLALHGDDTSLRRASLNGVASDAHATLEDVGGVAGGLLRLALASGDVRFAVTGRALIEACRAGDGTVRAPAGPDPVLASRGLATEADPSDGATPSGRALVADAALLLAALTGDDAHRRLAIDAALPALARAADEPSAFGAALAVASALIEPVRQLVVVVPDGDRETTDTAEMVDVARAWRGGVAAVVTESQSRVWADAGFELFAERASREGRATAYLCEHFVCALPVTSAAELRALLGTRA
ncbi:MAG TPA: DUF255 domain-containing protein [Pseudolysinimonas sp.]|nr:DUF255 domain-containing protein [Pseudolysinimonas sp.]